MKEDEKKYNPAVGLSDLRDDVVGESLPIEKILGDAEQRDRYFVVPQVVE